MSSVLNPHNTQTTSLVEALHQLLLEGKVQTQEDIKNALLQLGYTTNQSKISRLLRKLGALKIINDSGQAVYRLPHEFTPPSTRSPLTQLVTAVSSSDALIVIHTSPGSASLIARLLDHRHQEIGILGSVAGDDTVLIIPKHSSEIKNICQHIKRLLATVKL